MVWVTITFISNLTLINSFNAWCRFFDLLLVLCSCTNFYITASSTQHSKFHKHHCFFKFFRRWRLDSWETKSFCSVSATKLYLYNIITKSIGQFLREITNMRFTIYLIRNIDYFILFVTWRIPLCITWLAEEPSREIIYNRHSVT